MDAAGEKATRDEMAAVVELAKRRGFFFQSCRAYGGVSGFFTYGPHGAALKRELEDAWRDRFAVQEGNQEIHSPTVMPEPVFEASGHLDGFDDLLVECPTCGESHRADHLIEDATSLEEVEAMDLDRIQSLLGKHDIQCPTCGESLAGQEIEEFNLMFGTNIGPGSGSPGYLRPETAQGIFVEFPQLAEYARNQLPFGVTQIGTAYRNEISPRRSLVRVREFTQAELELFVGPDDTGPDLEAVADRELPFYGVDHQQGEGETVTKTVREAVDSGLVADAWIAYYLAISYEWYQHVGVDPDRFRFRQHQAGERAHYALDCWDAEAEIGGDWIELAGFAHRGQYDLQKHDAHGDDDFEIFQPYDEPIIEERPSVDPDMSVLGPEYGGDARAIANALESLVETDPSAFEGDAVTVTVDGRDIDVPIESTGFAIREEKVTGESITPEVIEPSFGIDRLVYTILIHALEYDTIDGEERTMLSLPPAVAPTLVGVFPLMDRDGLGDRASTLARRLREAGLSVTYDDSGNIGRRYRRQDEIGTPFGVTVDYDTLEDETVTLRDRDSTEQVRVAIEDLEATLKALRDGRTSIDDLQS